ncbi:MAG: hypothetical protein H0U52_01480 [Chloroflexi bacterium]|nr:hypothetical protein [Chloroflexota bacterium]
MTAMQVDAPAPDLRTFAAALWQPGDVREVRIPKHDGRRTASGYFDDPDTLAQAVGAWDGRACIYLTLNPVAPALLARAANRINVSAGPTTADTDIVRRRWMLIDVDPVRPSGISATVAENTAARDMARDVRAHLTELGWPAPIVTMTGNGYALLYRLDLPNDAASLALVNGALAYLAARFDSQEVTIDRTVGNAARIGAAVGTVKVKGDATPDRPHRRSALIQLPADLHVVPVGHLHALTPTVSTPTMLQLSQDRGLPAGWVGDWLDRAGVTYRVGERKGTTWYRLADCPFHPGEGAGDCGVGEAADGTGMGHCFHNRGVGMGWRDFRASLRLEGAPPISIITTPHLVPPVTMTTTTTTTTTTPVTTTTATIGARTAADLHHGTPPDQLVGPFLTPEGATVLYARGGTGKGVTACYLASQLVAADQVVMILDYEGHEREWGSRLRGLGVAPEHLPRIHYRAPFGVDWTAETGALSKVAGLVRDDAIALGVTYLIVDSYSVATSNGDTMGGEAAAREYFSALAVIGLPSLTIAHVRGDSGRFPERPFGSVFVHNLARETWAAERIGDDPTEADEFNPYQPNVVALELRNKKANGRAASAAQFLAFSFFADGTIEANDGRPGGRSVADLAAEVLADGPLTLPKIAAAIREDTGQKVSVDTVRSALGRAGGRFVQSAGKRPRTWSIR